MKVRQNSILDVETFGKERKSWLQVKEGRVEEWNCMLELAGAVQSDTNLASLLHSSSLKVST
jgi:hypothetical protein